MTGAEIAAIVTASGALFGSCTAMFTSLGTFMHFSTEVSSETKDTTNVGLVNEIIETKTKDTYTKTKRQEVNIHDANFMGLDGKLNFTQNGLVNQAENAITDQPSEDEIDFKTVARDAAVAGASKIVEHFASSSNDTPAPVAENTFNERKRSLLLQEGVTEEELRNFVIKLYKESKNKEEDIFLTPTNSMTAYMKSTESLSALDKSRSIEDIPDMERRASDTYIGGWVGKKAVETTRFLFKPFVPKDNNLAEALKKTISKESLSANSATNSSEPEASHILGDVTNPNSDSEV